MLLPSEQTIPVCEGAIGSWQISLRRRPLSAPELVRRYDQIAPSWYDLTRRLGYLHAYKQLWKQFLAESDFTSTSMKRRILDCGVGTGALSTGFVSASADPVDIHAVDLSEAMLKQARRHFGQAGIDANFRCADICNLPYGNDQFDLVMSAHVLEHLSNPTIALEQMSRVLKPGGWIVVCLTRESFMGRYVQLKWRTHRLTRKKGESWLRAAGLDVHPMKFDLSGCFRRTSLVFVGRKPIETKREQES